MNLPLPFTYLDLGQVLAAGPHKSRSKLYEEIKAGRWPEPDRIGGTSRWRSDRVAEAMQKLAAQADAEREDRAKAARDQVQKATEASRLKRVTRAS